MLIDNPVFDHKASIHWPCVAEGNMMLGVRTVEHWFIKHIGSHYRHWAWADSGDPYKIGVSFRQEKHCCFFVLTWDRVEPS